MSTNKTPGYETPTITELGSIAEFTRRDEFDLDFDGRFFRGPGIIDHIFGGGGSGGS